MTLKLSLLVSKLILKAGSKNRTLLNYCEFRTMAFGTEVDSDAEPIQ